MFSIPRYTHVRRNLSIVNPVNQLHVAQLVSDNWVEIRNRLKTTKTSEFRPEIVQSGPGRAVNGVDFDGVSRRRAEILSSYGRYVKTDVTRFYPSVYTHSIAWSFFGRSWVKQNLSTTKFKQSFAHLLDVAVASGQAGQTMGLPIGPDTSRILSELIACALEKILSESLPDLEHRCVRYVDDMLIGVADFETPSQILSKVPAALYEYELELNGEKTLVHGLGFSHAPEWIHFIKTFQISNGTERQRADLDSFFEHALYLAERNRQDNVLLFATKRAASFKIDDENRSHLVRWLLYATRRSSTCLSFVVEHLALLSGSGVSLPENEIESYIKMHLKSHSEAGHTWEVAWLLFWAREVGITLSSKDVAGLSRLRSGVVALLLFDLVQRGLITEKFDASLWMASATRDGLESETWLIAYEVTKKGWWPTQVSSDFIAAHDFFPIFGIGT